MLWMFHTMNILFDIDPNNGTGNSGLIIKADGTEIVRVKDTGRVGIGDTPDRFLHVNGGTTNTVQNSKVQILYAL